MFLKVIIMSEQKEKKLKIGLKNPVKQNSKSAAEQAAEDEEINARLDANYDGYYEDVMPIDFGNQGMAMKKGAMKQLAVCCGVGAVIIIAMIFVLFM